MKKITLTLAILCGLAVSAFADTARVKPGGAALFAAPNANSSVVASLSSDTLLEVIAIEGAWIKVRQAQPKREGYVRADAVEVQKAKPTPGKAAAKKSAPGPGAWTDRGYITVNGVFQGGKSGFSDAFSFPLYAETASVQTQYPLKNGNTYSLGLGIRVWKNLALTAHASGFTQTNTGAVTASLPKPFIFDSPRSLSGTAAQLNREESMVNLEAAWVFPIGRRALVTVSAGPARLTLRQSIVEQISYVESYPYDTATLASVQTSTQPKSKTTFGGGLDVGYYFTRSVGLGAVVRFASASMSVPGPSGNIDLTAGGVQAGVGLRLRFGGPKPPRRTPPRPAKPAAPPVKR